MFFIKKISLIRAIALLFTSILVGCASGASPGAMTVGVTQDTLPVASSKYQGSIGVGLVTGGSETNPLLKSEVSSNDLKTALTQSLALNDLLAPGAPKYVLIPSPAE